MKYDRELLELAAKAASYVIIASDSDGCVFVEDGRAWVWNPFNDDGDALRLAVKLRLTVKIEDHEIEVFNSFDFLESIFVDVNGNLQAATRRAIVLAAAEIGRGMP